MLEEHLTGSWVLKMHSKGTLRSLQEHSKGTWTPRHSNGTRALKPLGHLRYSSTWALKALEQTYSRSTRDTLFTRLNQVTSYLNWPRVLLFDLDQKQCNDIIKEWLDCLTPESIRRFLVNDILIIMAQNPIFFNEKIRIGRPEHSLTPTPYVR